MSRCFPYPPPYFGEAQIESIKKEKERLEVEAKKERKREKKEKKKEKRSGKDREHSKELKKSIKRKYEELGLVESTTDNHRSKKSKDEQLETSGLSEEHGLPSIKLRSSPQRSHDSSKRGNLGSTPSPSVSLTNSGSTLRIKLQPKSRDIVPQPQTSKPKATPQVVKSGELKPRTTSAPQKPRSDSVQQTLNPRAAPVVHTQKLKDHPVPESPVLPKPRDVIISHALKAVPKTNSIQKQPSSLKSETKLVQAQSSLVSRSSVSKEPVIKANIDEPCFSGRAMDANERRESKHHRHHHHHNHSSKKKSKRKEAERLFEELILNWKPANVENDQFGHFQHEIEDLDWLMSTGDKKGRVENKEEYVSAGGELLDHYTNGMMSGSTTYQTHAVYLPQLDMYQLPYVVPF